MTVTTPVGGKSQRARKPVTPVQRAIGLLTRREHSRKELTRKLAARGVEADEVVTAIDQLAQAGWQDDARFACSLARTRTSAGYGPLRIRAELAMHGLDAERITAALAACDTDWREAAQALVARRFTAVSLRDPAHRRKAIELLLRRGFDHADAFAAARVDGGDEIFEELGGDE